MAKKKSAGIKKKAANEVTATEPKFPYTTAPASLRTFFSLVHKKPRPAKVNMPLFKSWGITDGNASSIPRVLKTLNLISDNNEVTEHYTTFMAAGGGALLASEIRAVYAPLFDASLAPYNESDNDLRRMFNVHSGGSEKTLRFQVATFKVLCEFADFKAAPLPPAAAALGGGGVTPPPVTPPGTPPPPPASIQPFRIDLHIHLPENKSTRDYTAIIEDIAKFIYRHEVVSDE